MITSGSTKLQHGLIASEMANYVKRMNYDFGVAVVFYSEDEMVFSGSKESVMEAVIDHYYGCVGDAKDLHPDLFN
jgi:ATP sulfurylase